MARPDAMQLLQGLQVSARARLKVPLKLLKDVSHRSVNLCFSLGVRHLLQRQMSPTERESNSAFQSAAETDRMSHPGLTKLDGLCRSQAV